MVLKHTHVFKYTIQLTHMKDYIVVDIETCPINLDGYEELKDSAKNKLINPIDSQIVAMGVKINGGKNHIGYIGDKADTDYNYYSSEAVMLRNFWTYWKDNADIVGFYVKDFDLPFIVTRSFINAVKIKPFNVKKDIIDLKENLNAFKYGAARGKLKEYAELIGMDIREEDGSMVAQWVIDGDMKTLCEYLAQDLEITDAVYQRCKYTGILDIVRW